ncbi:MAG: GyrI-like domain-containing protein [Acidimicrobiia bacterium]|nr:GyrI-like domain-containing protein [Acidimicrobiia bacterium]
MAYEIQMTQTAPQLVAAIKTRTSRKTISSDIATGFGTLVHALASAGATAAGPPMVIYHSMIDEETEGDIELCIPVATPVESSNDIYSCEVGGDHIAMVMHRGPYHELSAAYGAITQWIGEHGHSPAGPPREIYLNDPQTVAPEDLLTRVEWPIAPPET